MADLKISALTGATTPLAGTEVLPIVQSGVTVKVASDNLTVKNLRSNATSGILQVAGPAAASIRVVTVPDANWTAARTDAAQTFTGDQTLSTGNLIVSNGKGIDFSATPGTGTSELLNDYEEGTCSLAISDGSISSTTTSCTYTKIGRQISVQIELYNVNVSALSNTNTLTIVGMPFNSGAAEKNCVLFCPNSVYFCLIGSITNSTITLFKVGNNVDATFLTKNNLTIPTNLTLRGVFTYFA
jgi:hypothetical protein